MQKSFDTLYFPDIIKVVAGWLSWLFRKSHTFMCPREFPVIISLCLRKSTQVNVQLSASPEIHVFSHSNMIVIFSFEKCMKFRK